MIEFDDSVRLRINAGKIWAFVQVAMMARQSQVVFGVRAAVLASTNMFDMERQDEIVFLRNSAALAALTGTIANELA